MNKIDKAIVTIVLVFVVPIFVFLLYFILVYTPISMYTEAQCLRQGYPKYKVSVGLERYCMNLTGSVTVTVEKAGK